MSSCQILPEIQAVCNRNVYWYNIIVVSENITDFKGQASPYCCYCESCLIVAVWYFCSNRQVKQILNNSLKWLIHARSFIQFGIFNPWTRIKGRRKAIQNNETALKLIEAFGWQATLHAWKRIKNMYINALYSSEAWINLIYIDFYCLLHFASARNRN